MNKTFRGGTETIEGMIPHKRMTIGGITLDAPVVIEKKTKPRGDTTYAVARKFGDFYLYALPGGGSVTDGEH